jgi:pSer/pThr/pTyr-binding forkhead associated (FHA) protein
MSITVIVRSAPGSDRRLTFDGTQRVVLGRGPGSDVRLPEASVSHRHATLEARGTDFVLVDEGSTNGTIVGGVRLAPRTSRIVRSGDEVTLGRVRLTLQIDGTPPTRDVAAVTRDIALELVSRLVGAAADVTVQVVEGKDQGSVLVLREEGQPYVIGRGPGCALPLSDPDASREHAVVSLRGSAVSLRDLGAKNGTRLGDLRAPPDREVVWRPAQMVKIGRTVLALRHPVTEALAAIESAPDDVLSPAGAEPPPAEAPSAGPSSQSVLAPTPRASRTPPRPRVRWSRADLLVMTAAVSILVLSLVGLVWLLRS